MIVGQTTCVSVLTPPGRGAIAVVAIQGPLAETAVDRHFLPASGRRLQQHTPRRIMFGRWGSPAGEEVVVCRLATGNIEIHCHGGVAASAAIVEQLEREGCQGIDWMEFVAQSEPDAIRVSAQQALAQATTERTAAILLDQYGGALTTAFEEIDRLSSSCNHDDHVAALDQVDALLARADVGLHLTMPWRVAMVGRPNVGKSSLINALLGYDRSIVFDTPGTTRDVVTALTAFDGWPVELADTAGIRLTADAIEAEGAARAEAQLADADLAILIFDASQPWTAEDKALQTRAPSALIVHNKIDLASSDNRPPGLCTSALNGDGLADLQGEIVRRLVPVSPHKGDAVPFLPAHVDRLLALQSRLAKNSSCRNISLWGRNSDTLDK